jgi:hypothetical protein
LSTATCVATSRAFAPAISSPCAGLRLLERCDRGLRARLRLIDLFGAGALNELVEVRLRLLELADRHQLLRLEIPRLERHQ